MSGGGVPPPVQSGTVANGRGIGGSISEPRPEGHMDTDDRYSEAVRRAMQAMPISRRELARRADLSHSVLNRIANSQRRATLEVAADVGLTLKELAREIDEAGDEIMDLWHDDPYVKTILGE